MNYSKLIAIDHTRLNGLAKELAGQDPQTPDWQIEGVLPKNNRAFVSHILYTITVNFSLVHFQPPYTRFSADGFQGSLALGRCFYRRFGENAIPSDTILEIASHPEKGQEFFKGDSLPPFLGNRLMNLQEVADGIKKHFQDNPMHILKAAEYRTDKLILLLAEKFPITFGQDFYADTKFYKKPKLFCVMYQGRALHSNGELQPLADPENIGPLIDYRVPAGLREAGILIYTAPLAKQIDSQTVVKRHSEEELVIRLAATDAVNELLKKINEYSATRGGQVWTMVELDNYLWKLGQKAKLPHHLTKTTDY